MSLPRGRRDLFQQLGLWVGFAVCYEVVRGLADRGRGVALANAEDVIALERRLGGLYDLDLQRFVLGIGRPLVELAGWTYWLSQFAVVLAVVVWVYLRHNDDYPALRNTLLVVNAIGLLGYLALPMAPPRMFPGLGYEDTLATGALTFRSGLVTLLANPYAAMPSLHAADALVIGAVVASIVRSPAARVALLLWPVWVWFALLATGNHFWLDVAAGAVLAGAVLAARAPSRRPPRRRRLADSNTWGARCGVCGNARRLWASRQGLIEPPRWTVDRWLAAAAMLEGRRIEWRFRRRAAGLPRAARTRCRWACWVATCDG
jgi:membrane-associated phospholipid phosphatase